MRKRQLAFVFLMAIALASAGTMEEGIGGDIAGSEDHNKLASVPRRSRFLAARDPTSSTGKRCGTDPSSTVCASAESPASACCNGQCVDTDGDVSNCGMCGKVCKFTESCCGGKCVDLVFDKRHCGKCFNRCKNRCFYGLCDYA